MAGKKVLLVEWDRHAADERAARLQEAGHQVLVESDDGGRAYRTARAEKPAAVVLDLRVRPSHSLQTARPLASASGPQLIFVDGTDHDRDRAAELASAAIVTTSDRLATVLDGL
jgi:DNA-binding response OmpR family regulator